MGLRQVGKNIARMSVLLVLVSIAAFFLVTVSPLDPLRTNVGQAALGSMSQEQIAQLEEYWGVNTPLWERYANWFGDLLHGDLGTSLRFNAPVADVIATRAVNSLALMATAWVVSGVLGFGYVGIFVAQAASPVIPALIGGAYLRHWTRSHGVERGK